MKKVLLVGKTGSGKTTLIQKLRSESVRYSKTQAITYRGTFIDSPGEFLENRRFYSALLTSSLQCDLIALVQDASMGHSNYPPRFASMFNKQVIGIVTKTDKEKSDPRRAEKFLRWAGADIVFRTSAVAEQGLEQLKEYLAQD